MSTNKLEDLYREDSVENALSGFGSDKDPDSHTKPSGEFLSEEQIKRLYAHDSVARKIVDKPAGDATKEGWSITDSEDESLFEDKRKSLEVVDKIEEAIRLSRFSGGCGMLMVLDDNRKMDKPVDWSQVRDIKSLRTFTAFELDSLGTDWDVRSENFKNPRKYQLTPEGKSEVLDDKGNKISTTKEIHADRIIRFTGADIPYETGIDHIDDWGQLVICSGWNAIKGVASSHAAVKSAIHFFQFSVLKMGNLSETIINNENGRQIIRNRLNVMREGMNALNAIPLDTDLDEDMELKKTDFSGILEGFSLMQQYLSLDTEIPISMLFGQAPQGLSAEDNTGRSNYFDMIGRIQTKQILRALKKIMLAIGWSLRSRKINEPKIEFEQIQKDSEEEQAKAELTQAKADKIWHSMNVLDAKQISNRRFPDKEVPGQQTSDLLRGDSGVDPMKDLRGDVRLEPFDTIRDKELPEAVKDLDSELRRTFVDAYNQAFKNNGGMSPELRHEAAIEEGWRALDNAAA